MGDYLFVYIIYLQSVLTENIEDKKNANKTQFAGYSKTCV